MFIKCKKITCKMYISRNKSCKKQTHKNQISFIHSYSALSVGFYLQNHLTHSASELPHLAQQPWLQFLKAPHLLALAMNSFSRGPSICQNAAVWVTSVK